MDNSNSGQESGQNSGSSRRTRSQTGLVVVKEGEEVGPKKSLNFVGKKSRVYGKNHVKDSKKRKRLKNVNVGVVGFPKRRKVNDDDGEGKAKKSRDLEDECVEKKGQNLGSSRRNRSQTGLVVVKEGEEVGPKKSLNFVGKKSRVYGKNHVKKSKKRKRLKNVNVGVVGFPKRRKVNDDDGEGKAKKSRDLEDVCVEKKGQNSGSSRRNRSQTGLVVVKEGEKVGPKKSLNFVGKKSRVYGKNHVKKSKKRKRLKNVNVGVVGFPKRRKVNDDDGEDKAKKSCNLEIGSSIVRPKKRYRPRVGAQTNVEAVNMLKEKLDAKQIQMFRETCFGRFLDLPPVVVQHQLAHSLLLREVVEEKDDALWISVKDVKLRFGLVEFGIITGLKCTGDAYKCCDSDGMGQLINTYFPSEQSRVAKQSLIDCINDKRFKSDEDAVKLAVLYFIHTFLFSTVKRKHITRDDFELVESGAYETYPWGKAVFKAIMKAMKGKLQGKPSFYRLGGLPLAFQCWFYECCPYVNNKIAFRVDDKVPRILSWKVTKQPTFKELWDVIFRQKQDQLKLRNISPTEFEKATLDLPESIDDERVNEVASRDIAEIHMAEVHIAQDFSSPPPRASRKQLKTKRNPALNNDDDWSTELKRLSDGQSELKSEIQMLNNELASLNDCMRTSFANVFKAIESLSKKQGEKTASELDGANDPHDRHGESNSSEFSNSDDNGSEGQEQGGDKDNNEKANEAATGDVEGEDKLGDPVKEVERMDISEAQILPDTCEVSDHFTPEQLTKPSDLTPVPESPQVNQDDAGIEGSSKKSSDVDNVDYSLLTEFDKWVDEGMKKQSK